MGTNPDLDHPYSPTGAAGDVIFVSGCLPVDAEENLVTTRPEAIKAALSMVERRLATAGLTLQNVVKLTYFVTDISDRTLANKQYEDTWSEPRPARTVVEVSNLPRGASVEIDAIAYRTAA